VQNVGVPPGLSNVDGLVGRARARAKAMTMDAKPRLRTVIVTCMDARIDPSALFGLRPGEAHILRNAGARVTPDVLRSLAVSQSLLGTTEVLVLGHTHCGLLEHSEEELSGAVERASGHRPDMPMGAFSNLDNAVRESVEVIRECAFLAHRDQVRGYVLDVNDGTIREAGDRPAETQARTAPSPLGLNALRADVLNLKRTRTAK
jgi:carbonic anhydrase